MNYFLYHLHYMLNRLAMAEAQLGLKAQKDPLVLPDQKVHKGLLGLRDLKGLLEMMEIQARQDLRGLRGLLVREVD